MPISEPSAERRGERGALLSIWAIALSAVMLGLGMAYLEVAPQSGRVAALRERQAVARAAADGALVVALHRHVPDAIAAGRATEAEVEVGAVPVAVRIEPTSANGADVIARARVEGRDPVRVTLRCEAVLDADGRARAVRIETGR